MLPVLAAVKIPPGLLVKTNDPDKFRLPPFQSMPPVLFQLRAKVTLLKVVMVLVPPLVVSKPLPLMVPPVQFRLSLSTRSPAPVSVPEETFSTTPAGRVSGVVVAKSSVPPLTVILPVVPVAAKPSLMLCVPWAIAILPPPSVQLPVSDPLVALNVSVFVPVTASVPLLLKPPLPPMVCEALTL